MEKSKGQSHMVALAAIQDAHGQIGEMNFEQKDLVILPVNDATLRRGNEGKHWSLLVLLRTAEGHNAGCFSAVLYDSARLASHQSRAAILASRFLGASAEVQTGECALQRNGFDCGIYLLLFSEIILKGFLSSPSWYAFRIAGQWQGELLEIMPAQATAYRQRMAGLYQDLVQAEGASQPQKVGSKLGSGPSQKPVCDDGPKKKPASADAKKKPASAGDKKLPPKKNQLRQGLKGSSSPHPWSSPYAGSQDASENKKRTTRHFRHFDEEGLLQLGAMSEEDARHACTKYNLIPPMEGNRRCWKCGDALVLKTWKATSKWNEKLEQRVECPPKQILACSGKQGGKRCTVRFLAPKAYTPMHNTTLTFKAYLLAAHCWSTQKCLDQTTRDLKGIAVRIRPRDNIHKNENP